MSDKRFVIKSTATELELYDGDVQIGEFPHFQWVAKSVDYVVDLLNKQQDTIITLKRRLEKINGGYGNLTHYKGLTANEWLIQGQERELKKKDKWISEWIEQHSKDIVKVGEQNKLIRNLKEENEQLKSDRRKDAKEFSSLFKQNLDLHLKNKKLQQENNKLKKICDKFEEAIEKRGYEDIDDFW